MPCSELNPLTTVRGQKNNAKAIRGAFRGHNWAPVFSQVLFLRHKYIHTAVRLTFKMPTQRKSEKILCRELQTEPSDVGKFNQSTQDGSNFSMPTWKSPAEIPEMRGCCKDELCAELLANRKLFRNAHYCNHCIITPGRGNFYSKCQEKWCLLFLICNPREPAFQSCGLPVVLRPLAPHHHS